jgi:excisionase family DNA binding protein
MTKGTLHEATLPGRAAFSVAEVCAQTGLGRDAIYDAIRSGKLVACKLGRRTLITHRDLHRFLASLPKVGARQAA